jgi:hypothetical protein
MAVEVPTRVVSNELIEIELLLKLSQVGSGDTVQVILVAIPAGFVTIIGRARISRSPIKQF